MDGKPSLRTIMQINLRFLMAAFALFYGWLCWQWTSKEWWGFGPIAFLCAVSGGCMMVGAIFKVVSLILRSREIDTFKRQGGTPRADSMVRDGDLKARRIIR